MQGENGGISRPLNIVFLIFSKRRLVIRLFHFLCAARRSGVQRLSCGNLISVIAPSGFGRPVDCHVFFFLFLFSNSAVTLPGCPRSVHYRVPRRNQIPTGMFDSFYVRFLLFGLLEVGDHYLSQLETLNRSLPFSFYCTNCSGASLGAAELLKWQEFLHASAALGDIEIGIFLAAQSVISNQFKKSTK